MMFLAGIVLHSMLIAAGQRPVVEFRVTDAYVSYTAKETNLGSSIKTTVGRNDKLSLDLNASPGNTQAKLLISSSGFKTDRPMRDWSVKTLYLKASQYPEITFELLKVDGEPLSTVLRPINKNIVIKTNPQDTTVDLLMPETANAPLILSVGKDEFSVEGKLRDDILNALHSDKGEIHISGRLTVAGGSKDFDTAVSFKQTGPATFALYTLIDAQFTDFGMTAPNLAWFITVHNKIALEGHAVIEVLK